MLSLTIILCALLLDAVCGEPRRFHPTVGFGRLAAWLESALNKQQFSGGLCAWLLAVVPFTALAIGLQQLTYETTSLTLLLHCLVVYWAIGRRSLREHALAVATPLQHGDLAQARYALSMIVSRDTQQLNSTDIARGATESVLENGADATLNAIFWYLVGGLPGIVLYRLSNTLDAMWGYRNQRFNRFGKSAARIDDVLNFVPARLSAFSYALAGNTRLALRCWQQQAKQWKSPNAGPVMAAGAGAINTRLGGEASYHGQVSIQPRLGPDTDASAASSHSLLMACQLVDKALLIWLATTGLIAVVGMVTGIGANG